MKDTIFKEVSGQSSSISKTNLISAAESYGLSLKFKGYNHEDGAEYSSACPFSGCSSDKDGFLLWPDAKNGKGKFWCRQCRAGGDTADFLEKIQGIPRNEALKMADINLEGSIRQPQKPHTELKQQLNRTLWSQQVTRFLDGLTRQLEGSEGEKVLEEKGISLETAKKFNLRYNPKDEYLSKNDWGIPITDEERKNKKFKFIIPAGLLIPIYNNGQIFRLAVRREKPQNGNRYHEVRGSDNQQPLLAGNSESDHTFIIESFLDVIKLNQDAGNLAGFLSSGGTSFTPDIQSLSSKQVHLSLDNDEPGINATKRLRALMPTANVFPVLQGKDPSEAWKNGLDLKTWVRAGITGEHYLIQGLQEEIGRIEALTRPETATPNEQNRASFRFVRLGDMEIRPTSWLIKGYVEEESISLFIGDPGCGKSFLSVDIACRVATGYSFHERKVKQGGVLYIAGEGFNGLQRRFRAWSIKNNISLNDAPIFISNMPTNLTDDDQLAHISNEIERIQNEVNQRISLIIIDTLARNFGNGNENDASDMGSFISGCDRLKATYKTTIAIIHHTGVADKTRARGSSALRGAVDAEFKLERYSKNKEIITFTCHKMKDAGYPEPVSFKIRSVELGLFDEDGEVVTSAILDPVPYPEDAETPLSSQRKTGKNQKIALMILHKLYNDHKENLGEGDYDTHQARVLCDDWKNACMQEMSYNRFWDVKKKLTEDGQIEADSHYVYITNI